MRYGLGENKEMTAGICDLIAKDFVCQDLMGTPLMQDQFVFLYDVHEAIYESCLREEYLAFSEGDKQDRSLIFKEVIPMLVVFRAMLRIRDINDRKKADIDNEKEKAERRAALGIPEPEPEEEKLDIPLTDA